MKLQALTVSLLGIFLSSCANYQMHLAPEFHDQPIDSTSILSDSILHRIFLVGDAGYLDQTGKPSRVLEAISHHISTGNEHQTLLFLGDNLYPKGMPPKKNKSEYDKAEKILDAQLNITTINKGRSIFIPGNHDWYQGKKGILRQEKYLNKNYNNDGDEETSTEPLWLPKNGCPGPEVVDITDDMVLIIFDSQWFLRDWNSDHNPNHDCVLKSRDEFIIALEGAMKKNRNKTILVAMHHPILSTGPHGGYYHWKNHLFPLTSLYKHLYLPLPVAGSLVALIRRSIGTSQDLANVQYRKLIQRVLASANKNGTMIFLSGHEHSLQYSEFRSGLGKGQKVIISGAGSKTNPAARTKESHFAYGNPGYAVMELTVGGDLYLSFYSENLKFKEKYDLIFRQRIKNRDTILDPPTPIIDQKDLGREKTVMTPLIRYRVEPEISTIRKWILGDHYRDIYARSFSLPVLELESKGLTPQSQGGGNQTNSLRLSDKDGRQFVLRDLTKDVTRFLPFPFNNMCSAEVLAMENFLSSHPFSATAAARIADNVGLYHTNPEILFVPFQSALGDYNEDFGGSVYLMEERPAGDWRGTDKFGNSEKIIGTDDLLEKLNKGHKHSIDQAWTLKARLVDILLGDWDRHDDQWRWARFTDPDGRYIYRPIPRDRDQAFSKYDGLLVTLAKSGPVAFLKQMGKYGGHIKDVKFTMWSARYFDKSFLNGLGWEEWEKEVSDIQEQLTDDRIEEAFRDWPNEIRKESGADIVKSLKIRRDELMETARKRYFFISSFVDVIGTSEKEYFNIERFKDGSLRVRVYEIQKGKDTKVYDRKFDPDVTKEVHIYGRDGDDFFEITGQSDKRSVKVRMIGGEGKDRFLDRSNTKGMRTSAILYDDQSDNNIIESGKQTREKISDRLVNNQYIRKAPHYEYDIDMKLPYIGANPDDGFTAGLGYHYRKYGFMKDPYHSSYTIRASYAFGSRSPQGGFDYELLDAIGGLDITASGLFRHQNFAFNYFGTGIDSEIDLDNNDIEYYRVRQGRVHLQAGIRKRFASEAGRLELTGYYDRFKIRDTPGRFISEYAPPENEGFFEGRSFAGLNIQFEYSNLDNDLFPHSGIRWMISGGPRLELQEKNNLIGHLQSELTLYHSIDPAGRLVTSLHMGFALSTGKEVPFYLMPDIGGDRSLRAYRHNRFRDEKASWGSLDIRYRILNSENEILPFSMGVFGGFDLGTVWGKKDTSEDWKHNYGGGIWISPLQTLQASLGIFIPEDQKFEGNYRVQFSFGVKM